MDSTFKNANILIVDDKDSNIELLEGLLEASGYFNLKSTNDSRRVMDLYHSFEPDLILLDLMMPHLSGFEVMEALKEVIPPHTYLPVLVLTADLNYESKQRALSVGAKDFLAKPFDLNEVSIRIKNLLETRYLHLQLEDQNRNLAQKVQERTQELETAYAKIVSVNKELELLDNAKLDFLKIINHEIRTPLNGILGFTGILKQQVEMPQLLQYIDYLELSAKRLESFSTKALMITQLRTGKYVFRLQDINLGVLFQNAINRNKTNLHEKELKVSVSDEAYSVFLNADTELIELTVDSLLDNAIRFSPKGGVIQIECGFGENNIYIRISDDGPGFSEKAMKSLFDTFGIGDKHVDNNVGLNLAIVKLIIDQYKGEIVVTNSPEGGANIKIELPH